MSTRSVSPPIKHAFQSLAVGVGHVSSSRRLLPGLLIAGAQRCGTTSMYRTLAEHPAVVKAPWHKGIHYFDMNYEKGLSWYRAHFPLEARSRLAARAVGCEPLTFESSPYYLFHPLAGERIAKDLPTTKILVLVRDPVERAYSAHAHELARGFESEPFERALQLEPDRLRGQSDFIIETGGLSHSHQHHGYLARSRYAVQLEAMASYVGRDRIHVVDSGDFFTEPEKVYDEVLEFLGLPHCGYPEFERHNARSRPSMSKELRARLEATFVEDDERLTKWLGKTPSWRR